MPLTRFKPEVARLCSRRQDWFVTTPASAGIPGVIRRVIIGDDYYAPRRYYHEYDPDHYRGPGVGVYGPGFSFGVGPDW
jgi:hypothetical protein